MIVANYSKLATNKLDKLGEVLGDLRQVFQEMKVATGVKFTRRVSQGFSAAQDPYGKPWNAPNNLQITGRTKKFSYRPEEDGVVLFATDKKAVWFHFGTGKFGPKGAPFTILPKNGKFLVFTIGGRKVFARKVVHPGMPRRFLLPVEEQGMPPKWEEDAAEVFHFIVNKHLGATSG